MKEKFVKNDFIKDLRGFGRNTKNTQRSVRSVFSVRTLRMNIEKYALCFMVQIPSILNKYYV